MSGGQTTQHTKAAAVEGYHHAHEQGDKSDSGMKDKMQHIKEDAKGALKKMAHPFEKEKKAEDNAQKEMNKEHHTHERQEMNATKRGEAAHQDAEAQYGGKTHSTGASLEPEGEGGRVHGGESAVDRVMNKITPGQGTTRTGPRGGYGHLEKTFGGTTGAGLGGKYGPPGGDFGHQL